MSPTAQPSVQESPLSTSPAPASGKRKRHAAPNPDTAVLPIELEIEPWPDALMDQHGHDPRSAYAETFWLPILGPSTMWLLRRLATGFDHEPDGFRVRCPDLAVELGLSTSLSRNSSFVRAIDRATKFGLAQLHDYQLYVRLHLPPLAAHHVRRLPQRLADLHTGWPAPSASTGVDHEVQIRRARRLALALFELGEDAGGCERQLNEWHHHPAISFDASQWAANRHREAFEAARSSGTGGPPDW